MTIVAGASAQQLMLAQLRDMQRQAPSVAEKPSMSFADHLANEVQGVNQQIISADQSAKNVATGKDDNIQETMIKATEAQLSFELMVQVRNKLLEAYQELMRTQV